MKVNKRFLIFLAIFLIVILGINLLDKSKITGQTKSNQQIQIYPLTQQEVNIIAETILSSEFIGDLPKKGIIGLRFFDFKGGERIWQSGFLIGKSGFLSEGNPDIILLMHSKYISQLNGKNLCEIVSSARANGDLSVETEISNVKLLIKYSGMLKHRDCFGF